MSHSVLFYFIVIVILVEYLTGFIKNATIIRMPRLLLKDKSPFFRELLSCGYCLSVWVSFAVVAISLLGPGLPDLLQNLYLNFVCVWLLATSLSNAWHGFRDRYLETYKDIRYTKSGEFLEDE